MKGAESRDSYFPNPLNFLEMLFNLDAMRLKHERMINEMFPLIM